MQGVKRADASHLSDDLRALVDDLRTIGEDAPESGALDRAGNPYRPSYYLRAVETAVKKNQVLERVLKWVHEPPTTGFNALADAGRADLTVEALVLREGTAYAYHFTMADREAADRRLEPFRERKRRVEAEELERRARIEAIKTSGQRMDLPELRGGRQTRGG